MPRVHMERAALFAVSAAASALSGCASGGGSGSPYGTDRGAAVVDEPDETKSAPIDGPEDTPPICQAQFFGADPLSLEQSAPSCSYSLAVSVLNPANVVVKIGGAARASGSEEDGWELLADGTTVLLLGAACDDVLAGAGVELLALCE